MHTCLIHIFIYESYWYKKYFVYISHTHDTFVNKYVLHTKSLVCVKRLVHIYISHTHDTYVDKYVSLVCDCTYVCDCIVCVWNTHTLHIIYISHTHDTCVCERYIWMISYIFHAYDTNINSDVLCVCDCTYVCDCIVCVWNTHTVHFIHILHTHDVWNRYMDDFLYISHDTHVNTYVSCVCDCTYVCVWNTHTIHFIYVPHTHDTCVCKIYIWMISYIFHTHTIYM